MSDAEKKESCCMMCGKKGTGLVMDATFHEDSTKIHGAMKKIFAALGLPKENIGIVAFVLEKPQTLCSSCHSSMHTLLALQGEVTALEGSMRKYAIQGFGEAIRKSLGKEQENRPPTPSDAITETIMWTKFQLPVLQNFTSGRIRVPSQDAEDSSDDEDEDEDEEDSSSSHPSPPVVVVKEEELEEGEVRENSGKRIAKNCQEKAAEEMDSRPGTGSKMPLSVVSTTEERETESDRTERKRRESCDRRQRNRSREADKIRKRNLSRESENDNSKKLKEDKRPSTSSLSSTPSTDRESTVTVASSDKPDERGRSPGRRGRSPCGWIVVFGHSNSSSRREKRREWRCQRSCSLNIAEGRNELRRSLVESRGRTVKSYGFVPEREEETRERGERKRMGGRCVARGCHASGDWFDVPGLLGHIHGENHINGMIGNLSK